MIIRGQFLTIFPQRIVQGYKYSTERSFLRANNSKIRCIHVQILNKSFLQNHWATSLDKMFLAICKREHSHYYTNTFVQVFKLWPLNIYMYSQLCSHYISPFYTGMTLLWANCSFWDNFQKLSLTIIFHCKKLWDLNKLKEECFVPCLVEIDSVVLKKSSIDRIF